MGLHTSFRDAKNEVGRTLTIFTNSKHALREARESHIGAEGLTFYHNQMVLARNDLAAAKIAAASVLKDGLSSAFADANARVAEASRQLKIAQDAGIARDVRDAKRALTKAKKSVSKIVYVRLVSEWKHVQGEVRLAVRVRNCSIDAARAAEYAEVKSLNEYYLQEKKAEEALAWVQKALGGLEDELVRLELQHLASIY